MAKRKSTTTATAEAPSTPRAEEYTVLARRYRPQQFAELVGQEPVAQALVNALKANRVAHAYLFTGARGVGKTSAARILAKALNCEKGTTPTPCDACNSCRSIAEGEDVDVIEIDGASNRRIEEAREIRGNVQYRPSRSRYKIYIIDEVHMLTREAFNALLKTLEEPPPHVKFIFATTEVQKIPITILSRCQRFDFAGIGMAKIVERLKDIAAREKVKADDRALALVARRAGGSMRDAQSLLDQLLAFGGSQLTEEQVHGLLGTASSERVAALAAAVLGHDAQKALALLQEAADSGLQLSELLDQLIDYWRDLLVVQCGGAEIEILSVNGSQCDDLLRHVKTLDVDTILAGLDVLVHAKNRLRSTSHGRVVIEMALVRLSRLDNLVSLAQIGQWLAQGGSPPKPRSAPAATAASAKPMIEPPEKKKPADDVEPGRRPLTDDAVQEIWGQLIARNGPILANILEKAENVAISGPNTLAVRFAPGYNLDENHYLDPTRLARLEEMLQELTGQPCRIRIEPSSQVGGRAEPAEQVAPGNSPTPPFHRRRTDAMQVPLVTRAMEVLGAQIVQVDDEFGAAPAVAAASEPSETEEA